MKIIDDTNDFNRDYNRMDYRLSCTQNCTFASVLSNIAFQLAFMSLCIPFRLDGDVADKVDENNMTEVCLCRRNHMCDRCGDDDAPAIINFAKRYVSAPMIRAL